MLSRKKRKQRKSDFARCYEALASEGYSKTKPPPEDHYLYGYWLKIKELKSRPTKPFKKPIIVSFYSSPEWRTLRYSFLRTQKGACQCCGATGKSSGRPMHVDHIKPISRFPSLKLDINNLQLLCEDCNLGKSNTDCIDWRLQ